MSTRDVGIGASGTIDPVRLDPSAGSIRRRPIAPVARRHRILNAVATHAILIALAAAFLIPFFFVVTTSLMTRQQVLTPKVIPDPVRWQNYPDAFKEVDLWGASWNTIQIAVLSTVGTVLSCIPVAYALARMRWRGRQAVFILILGTLMLPFQVTIVPLYVVYANVLHWIGTLRPLIIPSFFGDAFSIFLLRQFFLSIPDELSDAARVDGASEWQIMTRVVVPLAKPAIAAVGLFNFLYAWNDFFAPLLFLGNNPKLWTLSLALLGFQGQRYAQSNLMMAASVIFLIPVIVLFFVAQRVFIEGVTLTGVKG